VREKRECRRNNQKERRGKPAEKRSRGGGKGPLLRRMLAHRGGRLFPLGSGEKPPRSPKISEKRTHWFTLPIDKSIRERNPDDRSEERYREQNDGIVAQTGRREPVPGFDSSPHRRPQ